MMDKKAPLLELFALARKELVEEKMIKDIGLNQEEENMDFRSEIEEVIKIDDDDDQEEEKDDGQEEEEEDVYKDLMLHPKVIRWVDQASGKTVHGIEVQNVGLSTDCQRRQFDLCPICLEPFTLDKIHQMSCLPCGHIFGMSCLMELIRDASTDKCPECHKGFLLEGIRLIYATSICIPSCAYQKAFVAHLPFSKIGFTIFKKYELALRTNALNNRSDALKQRADVLGRQNDAMKRRTELLNRMADTKKRVEVLERQNEAMKWQTELLNRVNDEEEWAEASEQQADTEKRAEVLRRKAGALGQWADEYLRKADAFGQQAEALRQQAKSLRQLADSYLASRKFFIQSYKEFLGLQRKKTTL